MHLSVAVGGQMGSAGPERGTLAVGQGQEEEKVR